jgi:hypothetical protein
LELLGFSLLANLAGADFPLSCPEAQFNNLTPIKITISETKLPRRIGRQNEAIRQPSSS